MSKIKTLTLRPSAAGGYRETFTDWKDRWADVIAGRESFKAAAMSGGNASWSTGQLPVMYTELYKGKARHADQFVVYSYSTPIGWLLEDGSWFIPDHRYSVTTSRHQSHLVHILNYMDRKIHQL